MKTSIAIGTALCLNISYIHTYSTYIYTHTVHTYIHTYIHTYLHTYLHTYRPNDGPPPLPLYKDQRAKRPTKTPHKQNNELAR